MYNVKQMLTQNQSDNKKLLSDYSADFWNEYKNNNADYDEYFKTMYKSFVFFDQEDTDTLAQVTDAFRDTVKRYLKANDKRLSELWRINIVEDNEDYSIIENYSRHERYSGTTTEQGAITSGKRNDTTDYKVGDQQIDAVDKVTAFNSNDENVSTSNHSKSGTRNDITNFVKGSETDTTNNLGTNEYSIDAHGAIGTQTADQVIEIHEKYWSNTQLFYEFVFKEIASRFLIIGD